MSDPKASTEFQWNDLLPGMTLNDTSGALLGMGQSLLERRVQTYEYVPKHFALRQLLPDGSMIMADGQGNTLIATPRKLPIYLGTAAKAMKGSGWALSVGTGLYEGYENYKHGNIPGAIREAATGIFSAAASAAVGTTVGVLLAATPVGWVTIAVGAGAAGITMSITTSAASDAFSQPIESLISDAIGGAKDLFVEAQNGVLSAVALTQEQAESLVETVTQYSHAVFATDDENFDALLDGSSLDPATISPEELVEQMQSEIESGFEANEAAGIDYCFAAGTPIHMADGSWKAIQDIRTDDMVLAFGAASGSAALRPQRVTQTQVNPDQPVIDFHGTLVTPGHVFLTGEGGFERLDKIIENDGTVVAADGTIVRARTGRAVAEEESVGVSGCSVRMFADYGDPIGMVTPVSQCTVYNFAVDGDHTYVADGWRVHNSSLETIGGATGAVVGGYLGVQLARMLGSDNLVTDFVGGALGGTVGGWAGANIGREAAGQGSLTLDEALVIERFGGAIANQVVGYAGGQLGMQLVEKFGFESDIARIGGQIVGGAVATQILARLTVNVLGSTSPAAFDLAAANFLNLQVVDTVVATEFGDVVIKSVQPGSFGTALGHAGGAAAGQFIGMEFADMLFGVDSVEAATGGAIGGAVGASIGAAIAMGMQAGAQAGATTAGPVGAAVGAFIGAVAGAFFGGLLGSGSPRPRAGRVVDVVHPDRFEGGPRFVAAHDYQKQGGDSDIADYMAATAATTLGAMMELIGGEVFFTEDVYYGHYEDEFFYQDRGNAAPGESARVLFDTVGEAVQAGIVYQLKTARIEGGDPVLKRMLQLTDAVTMDDFLQDMDHARVYGDRLNNPALFDEAIAQATILGATDTEQAEQVDRYNDAVARAAVLGLDTALASDWDAQPDAPVLALGNGQATLTGGLGDDILIVDGSAATNRVEGGDGNDSYIIARGDGAVTIADNAVLASESYRNTVEGVEHDHPDDVPDPESVNIAVDAGLDRILFAPGVAPGDLTLAQQGNDLLIGIQDPANPGQPLANLSDVVTVENWYLSSIERVEFLEFIADGTIYTVPPTGTPSLIAADINATAATGATLAGSFSTDRLTAGDNSTLQGSAGDDTYVFNRGNGAVDIADGHVIEQPFTAVEIDAVADVPELGTIPPTKWVPRTNDEIKRTRIDGGRDVLEFGANIRPEDLELSVDGEDLLVGLRDLKQTTPVDQLPDYVRIVNWFDVGQRIELFRFADGSEYIPFGDRHGDSSLIPLSFEVDDPDGLVAAVDADFSTDSLSIPVIAVDLAGDGLQLIAATDTNVVFDWDDDGYMERTGWIGPSDGLLVRDLDGDGRINGVTELVTSLASLDPSDPDAITMSELDPNDSNGIYRFDDGGGATSFDAMRVWVDDNQDGQTDLDELRTLNEVGLTSIAMAGYDITETVNGQELQSALPITLIDNGFRQSDMAYGVALAYNGDGVKVGPYAGDDDHVLIEAEGGDNVVIPIGGAALAATFDVNTARTLTGSDVGDSLSVSDLPGAVEGEFGVQINAGGGNDSLTGGLGNDVLTGGEGADTISGGGGDDLLTVDLADNLANIDGGAGTDMVVLEGDGGFLVDIADLNAEVAIGGLGKDTLSTTATDGAVISGGGGEDRLTGGAGDDQLDGEVGHDLVQGGAGDDLIRGGVGRDTLRGGEGDDLIYFDADDDLAALDGGTGFDMGVVEGFQSVDINLAESGLEMAVGGDGNDDLATLATGGAVELYGALGHDKLTGGAGADVLAGGLGGDALDGGLGDDTLSGGLGADKFGYSAAGHGIDRIEDFEVGTDKVDLGGLFADQGLNPANIADHVEIRTTAAAPTGGVDAIGDVLRTAIDQAVTADPRANDTDPAAGGLTVTGILRDGANGQAVLNADGSITYTPNTGFVGGDTVLYEVRDQDGLIDRATMTVAVGLAGGGGGSSLFRTEIEDMTLTGDTRISAFSFASDDNVVRLTSSSGYSGQDGVATYAFGGTTGQYDLTIGYHAEQDGGTTTTVTTGGSTITTINQYEAGSGSDPSTGNARTRQVSNVALTAGQDIVFSIDGNNYHSGAVDYIEFDPVGGGGPVNTAPVAVDDTLTAVEDAVLTVSGNVLANDINTDGPDALSIVSPAVLTGTYGSFDLSAEGNYVYTLNNTHSALTTLDSGQTLTETFTYVADDDGGSGLTDSATVTVTIEGADESPFGPEERVNLSVVGDQLQPFITPLANGDHLVTWTHRGDIENAYEVRARVYDSNGVGGTPIVIAEGLLTDDWTYRPSAVPLVNGGFLATWTTRKGQYNDGDNSGVFAQFYDAQYAPTGSVFQVNRADRSVYNQFSPYGVELDNGEIMLVWTSGDDDYDGYDVVGRRYAANGTTIGDEFVINTATTNDQRAQEIVKLTGGRFVVVWHDGTTTGSDHDVLARIYEQNADGSGVSQAVGNPFTVNLPTSPALSQDQPAVAALDNGDFVIAWESAALGDPSEGEIKARRYGPDGTERDPGVELTLNQSGTYVRHWPSLTALADGGFAAAWSSHGQDGSLEGVYAREFDGDGSPLGDELQVNEHTTNRQITPRIMRQAGDTRIVWASTGQGDGYDVYARSFPSALGTPNNVAPTANADSISVAEDSGVAATGNVLSNDEDGGDGGAMTVTDDGQKSGQYGTLTLDDDGDFSYALDNTNATVQALDSGQSLTDSFSYMVSDGIATDTGSLTVTINGVDEPSGGASFSVEIEDMTLTGDTRISAFGFASGSDVVRLTSSSGYSGQDGTATYAFAGTSGQYDLTIGYHVEQDGGTDTVVKIDGTTVTTLNHYEASSGSDPTAGNARTKLLSNKTVNAGDSITFDIDGHNWNSGAIDFIDFDPVGGAGNVAPIANDDTIHVVEDLGITAIGNLLANDIDVDNGPSALATDPEFLMGQYGAIELGTNGAVGYGLNSDNPIIQTLGHGETLTESFTYTVTDGAATDTAALNVVIHGADEPFVPELQPAERVNIDTVGDQMQVRMSALAGGGAVATWTEQNGPAGAVNRVRARVQDPDGTWGAEFIIAEGATASDWTHKSTVVRGAGGNLFFAWTTRDGTLNDGSKSGVFAQTFSPLGSSYSPFNAPVQVNHVTKETDSQHDPYAIKLDNGEYIVVWASEDDDYDDYDVAGQRFDIFGDKKGPEFRINTATANHQYEQRIVKLEDGRFVVVWQDGANGSGDFDITARIYEEAADGDGESQAVGNPFKVNLTAVPALEQGFPAIAALDNGGFVVGWQSGAISGSEHDMKARRFDADGNTLDVATELTLNQSGDREREHLDLAPKRGGGFTAVWTSVGQDGDQGGIYAREFGADGMAVADEFLVNDETANDQHGAKIVDLGDNVTQIAWVSTGQPEGFDIYARRFAGTPLNQNVAPIAVADSASVTEDAQLMATGDVLDNDVDPDGVSIPLEILNVGEQDGDYGTLVLKGDGDYTYVLTNSHPAVEFLDNGETLTDSFTYAASDGLASTQGALTVTINGQSEPGAGETVRIEAEGLVLNGYDVETNPVASGGALTHLPFDQPSGTTGTATYDFGLAGGIYSVHVAYVDESDGEGTLSLKINDTTHSTVPLIHETSEPGVSADSLRYNSLADVQILVPGDEIVLTGTLDGGEFARIDYIDFEPLSGGGGGNTPPVAVDDTASVDTTGSTTAAGDVLLNDSDANMDSLTVDNAGTLNGAYGDLVLEGDGDYTYTLDTADPAVSGLAAGSTLTDTLVYTVTDGADTDTATLTVTISNPSAIRMEAESLSFTGDGDVKNVTDASGGQALRLDQIAAGFEGQNYVATATFGGVAGTYDVTLGYFKEMDGGTTVTPTIDGSQKSAINLWQSGAPATPVAAGFNTTTYSNIALTPGDTVVLDVFGDNWNSGAVDYIEFALSGAAPIAVDLDGDGVEFLGLSANPLFDVTGDGAADQVHWTGPDDGFLVFDYDGDGIISHAAELVFTDWAETATTDLGALAEAFDTNQDGTFDANDTVWSQFAIWQDANSDGVADAGEVKALDDASIDITAIALTTDGVSQNANGVTYETGQVTTGSGSADFADATLPFVAGTLAAGSGIWFDADGAGAQAAEQIFDIAADGNLTVGVDIVATDLGPTAGDDGFDTDEDTARVYDVLADDSDPENDRLANLTIDQNGIHGDAVFNDDGTITYTPHPDYVGADTFTYLVTDASGNTDGASVDVTVKSVDDAPVASNVALSVNEDGTLNHNLLGNVTDGDTMAGMDLTLESWPKHGELTINGNNTITYSPDADYFGQDRFDYLATDPDGLTGTGEVIIDVASINDAPVMDTIPEKGEMIIESLGEAGTAYVRGKWSIFAAEVEHPDQLFWEIDGADTQTANWTVSLDQTIGEEAVLKLDWGPLDLTWCTVNMLLDVFDPDGAHDIQEVEFLNPAFSDPEHCNGGGGGPPIVLDMDGDGVNLIALADSAAKFDIDGDGKDDKTAWIGQGDGFLVYDFDGDGAVTFQEELVFTAWAQGAHSDLTALRIAFDTNHDDVFDAADDAFQDFAVWQDDGDGKSEAGEVQSLSALGITSIDLLALPVMEDVDAGFHFGTGSYQTENGDSFDFADVALTFDPSDTDIAKNPSQIGDAADDQLIGDDNRDRLHGRGGNDTLDGGKGRDYLSGGDGEDQLSGGDGRDTLNGGAGNDQLDGGKSADQLFGDAGDDMLHGGDGGDFLLGGDGADVVFGDDGNDLLQGGANGDLLDGGKGKDRLDGGAGNDVLFGGEGNDTLQGDAGDDIYFHTIGDGKDVIRNRDSAGYDALEIRGDIDIADIWFDQQGDDLVVQFQGHGGQVTVEDWYAAAPDQLDEIRTEQGAVVLPAQVNALVEAMAAFDPQDGGDTLALPAESAELDAVITASWQSSQAA